ncbi:hypothetical protein [Lacinutrix sp. MedPE-SW]|uniref:hypothetical protein n=1 Tax=Lacinutrix sp. MedPE-SW TaxID=1860087 RepID=UPI0025BFCAE8|nr:hypothetical protein [Lacinutrix sp. MedPE-SW]
MEEIKVLEELNNTAEKIIKIQEEMLAIKNAVSVKENNGKSNKILYILLILFGIAGLFSAFMIYKKTEK